MSEFDWHVPCPFCPEKFHGYRNPRTVAENPYCLLLDHVPKAHPERMVRCSSEALVAFWLTDDSCSNCGGLKAESVLKRIEEGQAICPTDKNYKIYVDPDKAKAYFYHFTEEQKQKFIDLYNAKRIAFRDPGYFYVRPYFFA